MRVDRIDSAGLASLLHGRRCIHMKGFGHSLQAPPPPSLLVHLRAADVLVFDGDDYAADSFVASMLAVGAGSPGSPILLAYKLQHDLDRFLASWSAQGEGIVHLYSLNISDSDAKRFAEVAASANDARDSAVVQEPAVYLGVSALMHSGGAIGEHGSVSVASWGGGIIVASEFWLLAALLGRDEHLAAMPSWLHWRADRIRAGSAPPEIEACRLRVVSHAALTHVDAEGSEPGKDCGSTL